MEGEAKNLPAGPLTTDDNLLPPITNDSSTPNLHPSFAATSSSGSTSPPQFLRHVQAAFKRHRPLGVMQSNNIRPRRTLVPQRANSKESTQHMGSQFDQKKSQDEILLSQKLRDCISQPQSMVSVSGGAPEDGSLAQSSEWGSTTKTQEGSYRPSNAHGDLLRYSSAYRDPVASYVLGPERLHLVEEQKKVHVESENIDRAQDMEWESSNQGGGRTTTTLRQDLKHQTIQRVEVDGSLRSEGGVSSPVPRTVGSSNQLHHFTNFLQNDSSQPMTQSSVVGSSCPATTLINSTSAPMLSSTTYCSQPQVTSSSHLGVESSVEVEMSSWRRSNEDVLQVSDLASKDLGRFPTNQVNAAVQSSSTLPGTKLDVLEVDHSKVRQTNALNECGNGNDPSPNDNAAEGDTTDKQSQAPLSNVPSSDVKLDASNLEKQEKGPSGKAASTSRKKNYDPDLFFKVNGKLYQRLGKIGSGGSSEVHKVISSDCKIYALKKIKLKGRDYATAYGFYQEIEYLNRFKGKNNIIQLIDYEVTGKTLLQEFISGSISNKDGRVKGDVHIYMVLEYGEIDLAHMLSQKWKELDSPNAIIDENWLRFYWQQILLAVNTIHKERIMHSDLKPANFLLVKGSLKLIDFGIAKAIMSDTTNIQRDAQVGTLSYMSPEAFMCNETDANGNTVKCGRPSDIWSLGCILYQMVYGTTPFAEYKTFWAKFKVITDPNHKITYEPVSNPWLLDIMKKCLAWDRNERWRIPQLLQHPFLVPPVPPQTTIPQRQLSNLLQIIANSCKNDRKGSTLCSLLQQLLSDRMPSLQSQTPLPTDQLCKLLCKISNICIQLQEQLATSGK